MPTASQTGGRAIEGLGPERAAPPARARRPPGIPLARVFGVEILADWSLLVVFALVTVQLGAIGLPGWHPEWRAALVWSEALLASLLFFASITVHELSHALVARLHGIPVRRITLFLFGGVAHLEHEPRSPLAELTMAAIGPLVSLAIGLGATFTGILLAGDAIRAFSVDAEHGYRMLGPGATLLLWLGPVNVALAIFNLVPGFPLDGGRVLRALLWWWTGDLRRATRWAAGAGALVGLAMIAIGVMRMLGGDVGSGLWLALIGWFLRGAARGAYGQMLVADALRGVPIERVMRSRIEVVAPELSLEALVHERIMGTDQVAFPVLRDDRVVGLVCLSDVRRVPRERWHDATVESVMTPAARLITIGVHATADEALERLAQHEVDQLPVIDDAGKLAGLVRRADIVKWLSLSEPELPT